RLIDMFVRATGNPRLSHRDISHGREEFLGEVVMAKHLAQPTTIVVKFFKRLPNNVRNGSGPKRHGNVPDRSGRHGNDSFPEEGELRVRPRYPQDKRHFETANSPKISECRATIPSPGEIIRRH